MEMLGEIHEEVREFPGFVLAMGTLQERGVTSKDYKNQIFKIFDKLEGHWIMTILHNHEFGAYVLDFKTQGCLWDAGKVSASNSLSSLHADDLDEDFKVQYTTMEQKNLIYATMQRCKSCFSPPLRSLMMKKTRPSTAGTTPKDNRKNIC